MGSTLEPVDLIDHEARRNSAVGFGPLSVTETLPPCFHDVFSFRYFNSIQADCFHALYHAGHSAVVASPTGSGKTSLFELAILGMLKEGLSADAATGMLAIDPRSRGQRKAIYVAPMKSLVQEKAQVRLLRSGVALSSALRAMFDPQ
jgi:replicative superfamily II helicase